MTRIAKSRRQDEERRTQPPSTTEQRRPLDQRQAPGLDLLGLQRSVGNQMVTRMLSQQTPPIVQRAKVSEGLRARFELFERGGSSLDKGPEKQKVSGDPVSFGKAKELFETTESKAQSTGEESKSLDQGGPSGEQEPTESKSAYQETDWAKLDEDSDEDKYDSDDEDTYDSDERDEAGEHSKSAYQETDWTKLNEESDEDKDEDKYDSDDEDKYDSDDEVKYESGGKESSPTGSTNTTELKDGGSVEQPPPVPDDSPFRSLRGGAWKGKRLDAHYKGSEKLKYNKEKEGFARAGWEGSNNRLIKYLSDEQRSAYELTMQKGSNLFFWRGEPINTANMQRAVTFNGMSGEGRVLFVMAVDGSVYVANEGEEFKAGLQEQNTQDKWRFNHSSFIRGKKIASAGELIFADGVLKGVTDNSGHYKPGLAQTLQVLRHFKSVGIDMSGVLVERYQQAPVDAETLLEFGDSLAMSESLKTYGSNADEFNDDSAETYAYYDAVDAFEAAVGQQQGTGLSLQPKLFGFISLTKKMAKEIPSDLEADNPRIPIAKQEAKLTLRALELIDQVNDAALNEDAIPDATELNSELATARELDQDEKTKSQVDLKEARLFANDLVEDLADAKADAKKTHDDTKSWELDQKLRARGAEYEKMTLDIPTAISALQELKEGRFEELQSLQLRSKYFVQATRSAGAKLNFPMKEVAAKLVSLGVAANQPSEFFDLADALVPGASGSVRDNPEQWPEGWNTEIATAGSQLADLLGQWDDKKLKLHECAFELQSELEHADVMFIRKAMKGVGEQRANDKKPVTDIASLISVILKPGADKLEDKDEIGDALDVYKFINRLVPGSFSEDFLDDLEDRV